MISSLDTSKESPKELGESFMSEWESIFPREYLTLDNTLKDHPIQDEKVFSLLILHGNREDWEYYTNRWDASVKIPKYADVFEDIAAYIFNPEFSPSEVHRDFPTLLSHIRNNTSSIASSITHTQERVSITIR